MRFSLAIASIASLCFRSKAQNLVETVVDTGILATLEAAVKQAELVDTLSGDGPFTVFAPTNESFAALDPALLEKLLEDDWKAHLTEVLLYHVADGNVTSGALSDGQIIEMKNGENVTIGISGDTVTVNDAEVEVADVLADNGVAHIIDAVLTPSFLETSIVDLAAAATTTLADLVEMAGLMDALAATDGSFTVFAPTNEAFAALDNETLTYLTSDDGMDDLVATLRYHVVPSVYASGAIPEGETMVESLQGTNLTIVKSGDSVTVNGVAVTSADNLANNGIVHVIGEVLTLEDDDDMPADGAFSVASMAAVASSLLLMLAF